MVSNTVKADRARHLEEVRKQHVLVDRALASGGGITCTSLSFSAW